MPGAETFRASADAYDRLVGRYGAPLAAALIGFAGIEPGMSALDVGCGPGALTGELVTRLGADRVRAADPSRPSWIRAGHGTPASTWSMRPPRRCRSATARSTPFSRSWS
jgi:trans-aconitate methyltransferase